MIDIINKYGFERSKNHEGKSFKQAYVRDGVIIALIQIMDFKPLWGIGCPRLGIITDCRGEDDLKIYYKAVNKKELCTK